MNYTIFQVKKDRTREFGFMDFNFQSDEENGGIHKENYDEVYSSSLSEDVVGEDKEDLAYLETLFRIFNVERPNDFTGRSLSISDVVVLDGCRTYYCDSFGWTRFQFN